MRYFHVFSFIIGFIIQLIEARNSGGYVVISHDGPVIIGGKITFRADIYSHDGTRPSGTFAYSWADDALHQHTYESESTENVTSYWSITYPVHEYKVGSYRVEVVVEQETAYVFWPTFARGVTVFEVTEFLNGNVTLTQSKKTLIEDYVSSKSETDMRVSIRKGDYDYIVAKATSISTFWFIDCKLFGQTTDFSLNYNFTQPDVTHVVETLVVASFDPLPPGTTVPPSTVAPVTTTMRPNVSTSTTIASTTLSTLKPERENYSFPFVCSNSSVIPQDPNKTYGYFTRDVKVRAPISNITVAGTNWLQPWEMLSLNVSCGGSGPFKKCLQVYRGTYNVTGNETCKESETLNNCSFPIIHYFLDPSVYTIVIVLNNDISKQIYPLTINIYKVTTQPQLSVIVVPVSCSLAAMVLIVFGVAYYIQSRARFTVEVADFDFGQHNPEMEYKTFTERLRDSFNNTLRPGGDRISGYEPLSKPLLN